MVVLVVCALALAAFGFDHALHRSRVLRRGPATAGVVALTFDDGPDPDHTPAILDILAAHEARATFFVVGEYAEQHPDLVRRMIDEGHEVAQHSYTHPDFECLDPGSIIEEFESSSRVLDAFGVSPTWYRPPRGELCLTQKNLAADRGMRVALWTRSFERAIFSSADQMAQVLVAETRPGDILLAHDGRLDRSMTVAALPAVLAGLGERDLTVVTLTELEGNR